MKLHFRLGFHFIGGLLLTMLGIGIMMAILFEGILPSLGIQNNDDQEFLSLLAILSGGIFVFGIIYGWYVGKPLLYLMRWIQELATGNYDHPKIKGDIFEKDGKVKRNFRLYQEVIENMQKLTEVLKQNEIERKQLDEMKRDWAAGISHDLKTPLTYITGYSTMMLSDQYSWDEQEKVSFLQEIQQKGYHMQELIKDLNLSFQMDSNQIPISASKNNIVEFVRRIVAEIANDPRAAKYDLDFYTDEMNIEMLFDEKLLRRALYNLLMNAVVHNLPHTQINVSIYRKEEIQIVIKDNGVGMDETTTQNLFNKYYRGVSTNHPVEGTGLGMAIAKQLILAHQGTIEVASKVEEGTTIFIKLPIRS